MTSPVDIVNRALSANGARQTIASLSENSPAAETCALWYETLRDQLLRTAPWGFARKTVALTQLGLLTDVPPASPYPWYAKYLYPTDCAKFRYILPPPVLPPTGTAPNVSSLVPSYINRPSRAHRYVRAYDDTVVPAREVILSNVPSAIGVYTATVTDPDRWDSLFTQALMAAIAFWTVIPLSGNVGLAASFSKMADDAVLKARVADGNEGITTADPRTDWIDARVVPGFGTYGWEGGLDGGMGQWNCTYDSMGWSM